MPQDLRTEILVALIGSMNALSRQLGKTQLQKLTYFLQELGVPLEYKYEIYHYGPYCFELTGDMNSLDSLGVINVESEPSGYGFSIKLGEFASKFKLSNDYKKAFDFVISNFGKDSASQLEVKATVHYVNRILKSQQRADKNNVIQKVKALKPQFTEDFIGECYDKIGALQLM